VLKESISCPYGVLVRPFLAYPHKKCIAFSLNNKEVRYKSWDSKTFGSSCRKDLMGTHYQASRACGLTCHAWKFKLLACFVVLYSWLVREVYPLIEGLTFHHPPSWGVNVMKEIVPATYRVLILSFFYLFLYSKKFYSS